MTRVGGEAVSRDANFLIPCIYPRDEAAGTGAKVNIGGMAIKVNKPEQGSLYY
jgi:hypothetical protein